ncbi:hypothetical protein [Kordiimonas lacus]|uniref:Uncharacterized protein n=1 Tax=Kordiimonas lacus TaxID=637679 RepID=A0A1G7DPF7_9PROT|nr:hypothetical protein [Kordiimonas lacus]SDE53433.1 hypothetical protein SAMN04488071_3200 [Kordiimonas lacus]
MPKQEKIAWILGIGSLLIASHMAMELPGLLHVENGLVTSHDGLMRLCLKVIIAGIMFESIGEFIRRRPSDEVDTDERDEEIRATADRFGLWVFAALVTSSIFSLTGWQMAGVTSVEIPTMAASLILMMVTSNIGRHIAEIYHYRIA